MNENSEEDDFEEIDFAAPIDIRFAITGIIIMIGSLITLAFSENFWLRNFSGILFFLSIFIMVKKKK